MGLKLASFIGSIKVIHPLAMNLLVIGMRILYFKYNKMHVWFKKKSDLKITLLWLNNIVNTDC